MNKSGLCNTHEGNSMEDKIPEPDYSLFDKYIDTKTLKLNNYTFYEKVSKLNHLQEVKFVQNIEHRIKQLGAEKTN